MRNAKTLSAYLSIIFGTGLILFETLINWNQWQWWPWWLVDYVAGVLLLIAGVTTLKSRSYGEKLLCTGWAFCLGMMWMSLAGNIASGTDPDRVGRVAGFYVALIVIAMTFALIGLLLALLGSRHMGGNDGK